MIVNKKEEESHFFSKKELLRSSKIEYTKDAINAILKDEEAYTMEEAVKLLKKFMEGDV